MIEKNIENDEKKTENLGIVSKVSELLLATLLISIFVPQEIISEIIPLLEIKDENIARKVTNKTKVIVDGNEYRKLPNGVLVKEYKNFEIHIDNNNTNHRYKIIAYYKKNIKNKDHILIHNLMVSSLDTMSWRIIPEYIYSKYEINDEQIFAVHRHKAGLDCSFKNLGTNKFEYCFSVDPDIGYSSIDNTAN